MENSKHIERVFIFIFSDAYEELNLATLCAQIGAINIGSMDDDHKENGGHFFCYSKQPVNYLSGLLFSSI